MKLIPKIVLVGVISVTLVMGGMGYFAYLKIKQNMLSNISNQLSADAEHAIARILEKQEDAILATEIIARSRVVAKALDILESRGVNQVLNDLVNIYPFVNYVMIATPDGSVFATSTRDKNGKKLQGEQLLLQQLDDNPMFAKPSNKHVVQGRPGQDPYMSIIGLEREITQWIFSPVKKRGEFIGWVVVSYDWQFVLSQALKDIMNELLSTGNPIKAVLLTDSEQKIQVSQLLDKEMTSSVWAKGKTFNPTNAVLWRSKLLSFGTRQTNVVIVSERETAFKSLNDIAYNISKAAILGAIILGLILFIALRQLILKKIEILHAGSEVIGSGNLKYQLPAMGSDEIGVLGQAINLMANNLDKTTASIDKLNNEVNERKLAQSQLTYVLESTPSGLILVNSEGKIEMVNNAIEHLFGYPREELMGQTVDYLVATEHRADHAAHIKAFFQNPKNRAMVTNSSFQGMCSDGRQINLEIGLSPLDTGEGIKVLTTVVDITARKKTEEKLQMFADRMEIKNLELDIALIKAEEATSAKSDFLANMSHEIRTPMNGVIGMTGLLLDTELSSEQRHFAETIRSSGESLLTLINDILDFSKIEAGQLDLEYIDFNLQVLMDDFATLMAYKAVEKQLEFISAVEPTVPVHLYGDPGRLRQILVNLAGNAIKFTQLGEIFAQVELVSEAEQHVTLCFRIRDTGPGIAEEHHQRLFDRFEQEDGSTTRRHGGTGLGLAICKQLAELMGGGDRCT